ncbi:MAG TPA: SH3 domain-containing protein [Kofleriaceae bacterium]|nr:SH3 domain-containing protein [Kofleriaceae bacterium]
MACEVQPRLAVLRLVGVCVIGSIAITADAAPWHTTEAVVLRKKAGEKEEIVAKLAANTPVDVLSEDGRWLRVRAGGSIGFLARTTVSDGTAPTGGAMNRWSASRRGSAQALFVEVTAPAAGLHAGPTPTAPTIAEVARGARLTVIDAATTPAWIRARDDSGRDGWIARTDVDNGASGVSVTGADLQGIGLERASFDRAATKPLAIRAAVAVGYRSIGMDFSSNAAGGLTNYVVDADAMAATVEVDVIMRRGRWFAAADVHSELANASPGIDYPGPTGPSGKIPFSTFETDLGARAGVRARDTFDLAARLGGHYDAFMTRSVDNAGMLPRERLAGATVGLRVEATPPHSRFGITGRFDYLVIGSRAQTPGLEDGQDSAAHAVWGGATFTVQIDRRFAFVTAYDFERATTRWSGPSVRDPGVTDAQRIDNIQLVRIGLSAGL